MFKLKRILDTLLFLSMVLITIPGIKGIDLSLGPLRLGRMQPFKFVFTGWLLLQAFWVVQNRTWKKSPIFRELWSKLLLLSLVAMDTLLLLGLLTERLGGRGFEILLALIFGQLAFMLVLIDSDFNFEPIRKGIWGATAVLVFFSILELFFPESKVTSQFLSVVRDVPKVFYQLGSSLSTVGLTEFCVRVIPLAIIFVRRSWIDQLVLFSLVEMLLLTLERSGVLSLIFILIFAGYRFWGQIHWKKAASAALISIILLFALKSPEQIIGRYLGGLFHIQFSENAAKPQSQASVSLPNTTRSQQLNEYSQSTETSNNERVYLWKMAIQGIKSKPWLGIGLDGFSYRMLNHIYPYENNRFQEGYHCHCLFLELAVSGGIFCGLAFAIFCILYVLKAWQVSFDQAASLLFALGQIPSVTLDARIYVSWLAITLFWFAGIALAVDIQRRNQIELD